MNNFNEHWKYLFVALLKFYPMLKRIFFVPRIRVKYYNNGRPIRPSIFLKDILLKSTYDLRYPEFLSKYLEMQYASIGGELHVHEDRVKGYDRLGNEVFFP